MLEGLWLRLMMGTEDVTRETAAEAATAFLCAVFPRHYPRRQLAAVPRIEISRREDKGNHAMGLSITKSLAAAAFAGTMALAFAGIARAADADVTVFDWSGYEAPDFHPDYVTKYGDSPTFAFFGDEDEAFEKLRSGFKADLAHPCSQSVVKWREAGLLQPLDTSKIAGWNDLLPASWR